MALVYIPACTQSNAPSGCTWRLLLGCRWRICPALLRRPSSLALLAQQICDLLPRKNRLPNDIPVRTDSTIDGNEGKCNTHNQLFRTYSSLTNQSKQRPSGAHEQSNCWLLPPATDANSETPASSSSACTCYLLTSPSHAYRLRHLFESLLCGVEAAVKRGCQRNRTVQTSELFVCGRAKNSLFSMSPGGWPP
jgi:hypothetical protein